MPRERITQRYSVRITQTAALNSNEKPIHVARNTYYILIKSKLTRQTLVNSLRARNDIAIHSEISKEVLNPTGTGHSIKLAIDTPFDSHHFGAAARIDRARARVRNAPNFHVRRPEWKKRTTRRKTNGIREKRRKQRGAVGNGRIRRPRRGVRRGGGGGRMRRRAAGRFAKSGTSSPLIVSIF